MPSPDLVGLFVGPLNHIGARYMVTGAVAAIMYGEPRLTNDIDVVIELDIPDATRLLEQFSPVEFYVPPFDVVEIEVSRVRFGHFNVIHNATSLKADFYPAGAEPLNHWGLDNRREMRTTRETIWTAPPEYVILLKLQYWRDGGSDKHARDIRTMLRVLGEDIDRSIIEREAKQRGLASLWATVAAS